MFEKIIVVVMGLVLLGFISAGCIQEGLVPCHIDEGIGEYNDDDMHVYTPWTSIWDAKKQKRLMAYNHQLKQEGFKRLAEDDNYLYSYLDTDLAINIASAVELKEQFFSPESPIALLLMGAPAFMLGWLGMSKPSDKKKLNGGNNG